MSGKKDRKNRQDLTALEDRYEIIGELSAREFLHEYLATRRGGGGDVRILVEDPPPGDAGNALTLFAADANLLASLEHRNLIPIHEGSWVGQDRFAVVTERCQYPTIDTLIGRGEHWSYPRIATILYQLKGLLDWARAQKVVHRAITLDTIHLEPETDRVLASFVAQPLTRQGPPGPEGDARTIASLAWSLITRGRDLPQTAEDSLGVVRPELPRMVVDATDALLHDQRVGDTEPPAVLDYIALVAMTEAIMRGEIEAARMQASLEQERVLEREDWAAKEQDYQKQIEDLERRRAEESEEAAATLEAERQRMADERAELERQIAAEREEMTRTLESERETLAATLETERAEMASARADLERRTEEEKEELRRAIADERTQLHETLTREREEMAALRADLERQVADEREGLAQDRARHEEEIAAERAAMAATIAEEQAAMRQTIADERARLEQTLADERARLDAEREEADVRLATERAEFEAAMKAQREEFEAAMAAQREEFDARLATERDEFDRIIIEERAALDADKEGFAVFNAAEREAIAAERRALEELYLAYEADDRLVDTAADEVTTPAAGDDDDDDDVRPTRRIAATFADLAPLAVAQPVIEPASDATQLEETESGLTRRGAKRAGRAAGGLTASAILLIGIIGAAAAGVGANRRDAADRATPAEREAAADLARAAQPTRAATPRTGAGVVDSAAGTVAPADSLSAVPQGGTATPPAPDQEQAPDRDPADDRAAAAPPRPERTVADTPASVGRADARGRDTARALPPLVAPFAPPTAPVQTPAADSLRAPARDSSRPPLPVPGRADDAFA